MIVVSDLILTLFDQATHGLFNDSWSSRKYQEKAYFIEILKFFKTGSYWCDYKSRFFKWKTLNYKHNLYLKFNIYEKIHDKLINFYIDLIKKNNNDVEVFNNLSTDTTFIYNKCCDGLSRNKYLKNKKCIKISTIVDKNGIPLSFYFDSANRHDSILGIFNYDKLNKKLKNKQINKNNNNYFLADSAYDSKSFRRLVENDGFKAIIMPNNRNTKDDTRKRKLTKAETLTYKKRSIVERFFAWLKKYPKLNMITEKSIKSYSSVVYLLSIMITINKLFNLNYYNVIEKSDNLSEKLKIKKNIKIKKI